MSILVLDMDKIVEQNNDIISRIQNHTLHYICDQLSDILIYNYISNVWKKNLIQNVRYHLNLRTANLISESYYENFIKMIIDDLEKNKKPLRKKKRPILSLLKRFLWLGKQKPENEYIKRLLTI
jgi:hypothetical protein